MVKVVDDCMEGADVSQAEAFFPMLLLNFHVLSHFGVASINICL
jgi:hypothetical protein